MNLPNALTPVLDYLKRHLKHEAVSNERLVLLLAAAVVLVLVSALYGLWSLTTHARDQLATAKVNLVRLQAEVSGDAWPKRVEVAQALKAQLSVRFWDAPTPGLAEAGFEAWLRGRFSKYGTDVQQVQITRSPAIGRDGQTPASMAGTQRMTAKVIAPFDSTATTQVLADIAEAEKIIVVDRLIVRAGANSRLEMDVSTFIRTNEPRAGGKAKP